MSDEHDRLKEREQGFKAQQILDNPVYQEAFNVFEENLRAHMEEPTSPDEVVLEARRTLICLRGLRRHIEEVFTTGHMAEMQLGENSNGRETAKH